MPHTLKTQKEFYTETEAADTLGISITKLHMLLDRYIFNDGSQRPYGVTFRGSDLLLLSYWDRTTDEDNILFMPPRPPQD